MKLDVLNKLIEIREAADKTRAEAMSVSVDLIRPLLDVPPEKQFAALMNAFALALATLKRVDATLLEAVSSVQLWLDQESRKSDQMHGTNGEDPDRSNS